MDQKERGASFETALRMAFEGMQSGLWTGMPAIIEKFNPAEQTVSARSAIKMRVRGRDSVTPPIKGAVLDKNNWWWAEIPLLVDLPVIFPGGGGFCLTFPIFPGDEVYVSFASRCIDSWWQSGGTQAQAELRMHSVSDGFAIPGPRSKPKVPTDIDDSACQLRSDDGEVYIELTREGDINIQATNVTIKNQVSIGDVVKKLVNETFLSGYDGHTHLSATPGSPTGAPIVSSDPATMLTQKLVAE